MNIVLICHVYPPEVAPAGFMVRELAEDLAVGGHRVTVLTGWPNHPRGILFGDRCARFRAVERDPAGFRVIRCGHSIHPRKRMFWRLWYYLTFAISTFVNGLAAGPFDAVFCLSTPIFGSWSAWLLARAKEARFVYTIFDLHPETARNTGVMREGLLYRVLRRVDTALCRLSDAVATLSPGLKREIADRGIEADRITVVPFWLDAERIRPGDRDNPWRRAQGIPPEKFVALYAGTIGYVSGAEILVDVASELRDRDDILILCVGEGVVKDKVEKEAARRDLKNLQFLPFQPEEVLSDMQATADVGLVTLRPESGRSSIPSKVLGYLAAGRAVVASVVEESDTAEMIRRADCGLVARCQDASALADAIRRAADDREGVERMGRNARRCLLEHYSRGHCVRLYEALLCGRRPSAEGRSASP